MRLPAVAAERSWFRLNLISVSADHSRSAPTARRRPDRRRWGRTRGRRAEWRHGGEPGANARADRDRGGCARRPRRCPNRGGPSGGPRRGGVHVVRHAVRPPRRREAREDADGHIGGELPEAHARRPGAPRGEGAHARALPVVHPGNPVLRGGQRRVFRGGGDREPVEIPAEELRRHRGG